MKTAGTGIYRVCSRADVPCGGHGTSVIDDARMSFAHTHARRADGRTDVILALVLAECAGSRTSTSAGVDIEGKAQQAQAVTYVERY